MFSRVFLIERVPLLVARMLPTLSVSMVVTQSIISLVHCTGRLLFPGESILTLIILHMVLQLSETNSLYTLKIQISCFKHNDKERRNPVVHSSCILVT